MSATDAKQTQDTNATQGKTVRRFAPCSFDPTEIFSTAMAISVLLYNELTVCEMNTVINLLTLTSANLSALAAQLEINAGQEVDPVV